MGLETLPIKVKTFYFCVFLWEHENIPNGSNSLMQQNHYINVENVIL